MLFTFLTLWLTFHSVVHFLTAYSKINWSVGPLCEHMQGDAFSIHLTAVSIMFCSRPIQTLPVTSDFTNIPKLYLVDTLLQDSQTL